MPEESELIDEEARRRFESEWHEGRPLDFESYLPEKGSPSYWPTLEELISIDLEFSWKHFDPSLTDETVSLGSSPTTRFKKLSKMLPIAENREVFERLQKYDRSLRDKSQNRQSEGQKNLGDDPGGTPKDQHESASAIGGDDFQKSGKDFGDFTLLEILGRGGMGVVFRALEHSTGREVALKMIRSNIIERVDAETQRVVLERFETEARAVAGIEHPNIVTLYQIGNYSNTPFISMQLVPGADLASKIRTSIFDGKIAARYMASVTNAIASAHEKGIIHRDLKPHNILLNETTDQPMVMDFGLAKLLGETESVTLTGELLGTPGYMSPEQALGEKVTESTDIYSLGATLYCLIGGRPPFQAADTLKTIEQIVKNPPIAPREVNPDVDRDLNTICLKCLEKDPAERYESARALEDDLKKYLNNEPIQARPIGRLASSIRWCRRNPLPTTVMIASVILLISVAIGWAMTSYYAGQNQINLLASQANQKRSHRLMRDQLFEISENKHLKVPGVKPVRAKILRRLKAYFAEFIEQNGNTPDVELDFAFAHFAIGKIEYDLASTEKAVDWLNQAIEIQNRLNLQNPNHELTLLDLSNSLNLRGECLLKQNQLADSQIDFEKSRQLRTRLTQMAPENLLYQRKLANAIMNLGNWFGYQDQEEEAIAAYIDSNKIRSELLNKKPVDPDLVFDAKYDQAKCWFNSAISYYNREKTDEALKTAVLSLNAFEKLHDERPRIIEIMRDYARCAGLVANIQTYEGKDPLKYLVNVVEANEALVRFYPEEKQFNGTLGQSQVVMGEYHVQQQEFEKAGSEFQLAIVNLKEAQKNTNDFDAVYAQALVGHAFIEIDRKDLKSAKNQLQTARQILETIRITNPESVNEDWKRLQLLEETLQSAIEADIQ